MVNIVPAANFVEATTPKSLGSTWEQFGVNRSEALGFYKVGAASSDSD